MWQYMVSYDCSDYKGDIFIEGPATVGSFYETAM